MPPLEPNATRSTPSPARALDAPHWIKGGLSYTDEHHVSWSVAEADCGHTPGARRPMCLIFVSQRSCRRVYTYPSTWASLSTEALIALSHQR